MQLNSFYIIIFVSISSLLLTSCTQRPSCIVTPITSAKINDQQLRSDLTFLASNAMQGRKTNTVGGFKARDFLNQRYQQLQLLPLYENQWIVPFKYTYQFQKRTGYNLVGSIRGHKYPDRYIVISAHYDHLGKRGHKIFNGADDNASGVAALLSIATYFSQHSPAYSLIFLATDAEEIGLKGAKAFVNQPPIPLERILVNINLDMLSQPSGKKILTLAGARRATQFLPLAHQLMAQAPVCVRLARDYSRFTTQHPQSIDWLRASDHGAFFDVDIPFLFFGIDPHPYYHTERDTVDKVNFPFLLASTETVVLTLLLIN